MPDSCIFFGCTTKVTQKMAKLCTEHPFLTIVAQSDWDEGKKTHRFCNLSLFMLVSWANETLRWRHKVNYTHSPVLLSISQKSAQLPCFERVQHLMEKSRTKNFFAKVIRAVAKVYLCEKNFGAWWHFNKHFMTKRACTWVLAFLDIQVKTYIRQLFYRLP